MRLPFAAGAASCPRVCRDVLLRVGAEGEAQALGGAAQVLDRGNWIKMPRIMLAKCAEAQALRRGWPEDLSGIYAPEEMDQAHAAEVDVNAAADQAEEDARLIKANAKDAVPFVWTYGGGVEFTPLGQVADKVMAFIRDNDAAQVDWFAGTNVEGLRQFWALAPGDALEVKKAIEAASKPTIPQGETE